MYQLLFSRWQQILFLSFWCTLDYTTHLDFTLVQNAGCRKPYKHIKGEVCWQQNSHSPGPSKKSLCEEIGAVWFYSGRMFKNLGRDNPNCLYHTQTTSKKRKDIKEVSASPSESFKPLSVPACTMTPSWVQWLSSYNKQIKQPTHTRFIQAGIKAAHEEDRQWSFSLSLHSTLQCHSSEGGIDTTIKILMKWEALSGIVLIPRALFRCILLIFSLGG